MPVLLRVANGATYSALVKTSCTFKMLGCECWNHSWKMGAGSGCGVEGQFLSFCFSVDFFFFYKMAVNLWKKPTLCADSQFCLISS